MAAVLFGLAAFAAVGGLTRILAIVRLDRALPVVQQPAQPQAAGRGASANSGPDSTSDSGEHPSWVTGWKAFGSRRVESQNRAEVIGLCAALVAELRAGRNPPEALAQAGRSHHLGAPRGVKSALADGDVLRGLRLDAQTPGREGLRALAACWQVAEQHGPGLADAAAGLVGSLRADEEHRRRIAAELAGPRATTRLLAMLPIVGITMGEALGAAPLPFLFGSSLGRTLLVAGIALEVAGLWWMSRITARALARGRP